MAVVIQTLRVDGLKELDRALGELPKAIGKNVLRRVLRKALAPIEAQAKAAAPVRTGTLRDSIVISSQLKRSQQRDSGKRGTVQMYVGPTAKAAPHAHLVEFGTAHRAPKPFMRPAFDANKTKVVEIIREELGIEIQKAWARLVKRAAKKAAK